MHGEAKDTGCSHSGQLGVPDLNEVFLCKRLFGRTSEEGLLKIINARSPVATTGDSVGPFQDAACLTSFDAERAGRLYFTLRETLALKASVDFESEHGGFDPKPSANQPVPHYTSTRGSRRVSAHIMSSKASTASRDGTRVGVLFPESEYGTSDAMGQGLPAFE